LQKEKCGTPRVSQSPGCKKFGEKQKYHWEKGTKKLSEGKCTPELAEKTIEAIETHDDFSK